MLVYILHGLLQKCVYYYKFSIASPNNAYISIYGIVQPPLITSEY